MAEKRQTPKKPKAKPKARPLNAREKAFARHYAITKNGKQSAIKAGYAEKSAEVTASKLIRKTKVAALIDALTEKTLAKVDITKEMVLQELRRVAMADHRDLAAWGMRPVLDPEGRPVIDPDGKPRQFFDYQLADSAALSEDAARTIQSVKFKTGENGTQITVKQHDKMAALQMLAKHLKIIDDKSGDGNEDDETVPLEPRKSMIIKNVSARIRPTPE